MARTNLEALRAQCKLICNTCYVDNDVLQHVLFSNGLEADAEPTAGDNTIVKAAILIVKGWVETSRSENGISTSVDVEGVKKNIVFWCNQSGLDASEYVDDLCSIEDGSKMW